MRNGRAFATNPERSGSTSTKTQYFEPVPLELWEYPIGGYQVLAKWLKDRRDQRLTLKEIKTYCRVVAAIQRSIALQEKINALCPEAQKNRSLKWRMARDTSRVLRLTKHLRSTSLRGSAVQTLAEPSSEETKVIKVTKVRRDRDDSINSLLRGQAYLRTRNM